MILFLLLENRMHACCFILLMKNYIEILNNKNSKIKINTSSLLLELMCDDQMAGDV